MKHFLFGIAFTFFLTLNTTGQVSYSKLDSLSAYTNCHWNKPGAEKKDTVVIRFRCAATVLNDKPLYVLDGVTTDEFKLKNLNPNDIESIWILKNSEATALYGCRAFSGAVLITTKIANQRTITVKDIHTYEPLTGANVDLISIERRMEPIHLVADSLGKVVINKITNGKEYELKVSCVGYKTFRLTSGTKQLAKNYTILLERNYEDLEEVTIKSFLGKLRTRNNNYDLNNFLVGHIRCVAAGVTVTENQILDARKEEFRETRIFPNPVLCSQKINIEFETKEDVKTTIRLFSMDNKLVSSTELQIKKGMNRISYSINNSLSAGIYVIQIINENNRLIKTDKLIIQ